MHQNGHVSAGSSMRVPIVTGGASQGGVQVWVAMHAGANLKVGLDAPSGTWIAPVAAGGSAGKTTDAFNAGIYNGSQSAGSPVPPASRGAVVVWPGAWPAGVFAATLQGSRPADPS